jgi:glycine oxidase
MAEVIVVGGGIVGMLTARELALAGVKVALLERQTVAQESSWAGGGIVSPLYPWRYSDSITRLAQYSQARYPKLAAQLAHDTGIDPEYEACGLLIAAPDEQAKAQQWAQRHAATLRLVERATIEAIEPALAEPPGSGIWLPAVAQVRNPRLTKAVRADLDHIGVAVHEDCPVSGFIGTGHKVEGVQTAAGPSHAAAVVVCAGAWTGALLQAFDNPPEIHPVRGQMLLFRATPGALRTMVLSDGRYTVPRRDGRVLFGSTLEHVGFDKGTTQAAYEELYGLATARFPLLRRYPVERQWAGLRPSSPAGIPYIARHPTIENLFVNAGHYRNGIVLGPASARLLADLLLERPPILPPEPYSLTAPRS